MLTLSVCVPFRCRVFYSSFFVYYYFRVFALISKLCMWMARQHLAASNLWLCVQFFSRVINTFNLLVAFFRSVVGVCTYFSDGLGWIFFFNFIVYTLRRQWPKDGSNTYLHTNKTTPKTEKSRNVSIFRVKSINHQIRHLAHSTDSDILHMTNTISLVASGRKSEKTRKKQMKSSRKCQFHLPFTPVLFPLHRTLSF